MQILGKSLKTANRARISVLRDGHENLGRANIDSCCMGLDATETGNCTTLTRTFLCLASPTHPFLLGSWAGQVVFSNRYSPKRDRCCTAQQRHHCFNHEAWNHAQERALTHHCGFGLLPAPRSPDRKSTRLNSSHEWISYAVFCF